MQGNKVRNRIYRNTFGVFFAVYLVLMIGFSGFLVSQEKDAASMEFRAHALQANNKVGAILQNYLDEEGNLSDSSKAKEDLLYEYPLFTLMDSEVAVFTEDHKLFFNTRSDWRIGYIKHIEGDRPYYGYAHLNPKDWFSEEKIKEIESYMYTTFRPEKQGDLSGYSLELQGLWVDEGMVIPEKIAVQSFYAQEFNEEGFATTRTGSNEVKTIYHSNYENTRNLPYFEEGHFSNTGIIKPNSVRQDALREMVLDLMTLKEAVSDPKALEGLPQRIGGLTYRYYVPMPYQNTVRVDASGIDADRRYTSKFWTVVGREINVGERCLPTLAFVWLTCFITFGLAALLLARQSFRAYRQQEELERGRKEMTNALAHDLKTPLSIISGYAENLQENIHTEKRAHYAAYIQANVKRMDQIIRNMLEMGRLEEASLRLDLEDMALAEACQTIIERYKPVWEEKEITTSLAGDAVIKGDYSLISRVLDNFFINALDNTPMGGRIDIEIGEGKLQIFNSGSFIPEDKISEIWLPFKKGDTARSNSKGTGIGLAIASTILELHKFSYGAENRGGGVVFCFQY